MKRMIVLTILLYLPLSALAWGVGVVDEAVKESADEFRVSRPPFTENDIKRWPRTNRHRCYRHR